MGRPGFRVLASSVVLMLAFAPVPASAQASGADTCARRSPAGAEAVKRRAPVSLYYELKLAIVSGQVFEWRGEARPRRVLADAAHVAASAGHGHAIDTANRVQRWAAGADKAEVVFEDAAFVAAGETGLLAIRCDGSLWQRKSGTAAFSRVAGAAIHAWVGDSADYYIDEKGRLHVSGRAHRGQYGNGQLEEASGWVVVADDAVAVYSHTGHAVYLRRDGAVLGTGGNRSGPLGKHGYGDKAVRWGVIFEGASRLGTGNRHSMAIRADGSLWSWGSADGLEPRRVLTDVLAAMGGDSDTLAMRADGSVWSWRVGSPPLRLNLLQ